MKIYVMMIVVSNGLSITDVWACVAYNLWVLVICIDTRYCNDFAQNWGTGKTGIMEYYHGILDVLLNLQEEILLQL